VASAPFVALGAMSRPLPLVAVDLGYSSRTRSCGIARTGSAECEALTFGEAISRVRGLLEENRGRVLVLEAALSTLHDLKGNPQIRCEEEKGRGWYWGPGVLSLVAATRFLNELAKRLKAGSPVRVAEAFLSNKTGPRAHIADAAQIVRQFWQTKPVRLAEGVEPLPMIRGVPSIRVFRADSKGDDR
jgi:hypothetical protein